jgi:hypothetical protein
MKKRINRKFGGVKLTEPFLGHSCAGRNPEPGLSSVNETPNLRTRFLTWAACQTTPWSCSHQSTFTQNLEAIFSLHAKRSISESRCLSSGRARYRAKLE